MSQLSRSQSQSIRDELQQTFEGLHFPRPAFGESEEKYVAENLTPLAHKTLIRYRDLVVNGEGRNRAAPVYFLDQFFYPDIGVMHYGDRIVAVEAKYVNFRDRIGDLATAVGQGVIYSTNGYLSSLIVLIGESPPEPIFEMVYNENLRLKELLAPWRLCVLRII